MKPLVVIKPLSFTEPKPLNNTVSVKRKSLRTSKVKNYKAFDSFGNDLSTEDDTSKSDQHKGETSSKKSNKKETKKELQQKNKESHHKPKKEGLSKPSFKSKRLQQQQIGEKESETEVSTMETEKTFKDETVEREESSDEAAKSQSTSDAKESDKESVHGDDQSIKTRPERKKLSKSYKDESGSSSEDEESNKPLSVIKKELSNSPGKVVTKVIKVMRKVRLKNGKIKKKLVKVIKKFKPVNSESGCPKVPGMRRTRCTKCAGCQIKEDCGECVFCL